MDSQAMRERVTDARVGRLATVTPDGRPHVVPVCFAVHGNAIVTAVDGKPKQRGGKLARLVNIAATGRAALLVDFYAEDWDQLWWVRVDARAEVGDIVEADPAVDALIAKYPQYADQPPPGPLITLTDLRWTGWAAA